MKIKKSSKKDYLYPRSFLQGKIYSIDESFLRSVRTGVDKFDLGSTLSFGNTSIQMAPKTPIYDASAIICKTNVTLLVRNRSFIEPVNSKKVETFCKPIESTAYCFNRKCK